MLRCENYSDADFSFLQLNIRSLPHNLVKLTDYLSCLNVFSCKLRFLFKTLGLIRSSRILSYTNHESGLIPKQIHVQTA